MLCLTQQALGSEASVASRHSHSLVALHGPKPVKSGTEIEKHGPLVTLARQGVSEVNE